MKKLFSTIPYLNNGHITLRKLNFSDADALHEMTRDDDVYRYLPTILFEKKYEDAKRVIERLYDECLEESLILGVFVKDDFCGLMELYAYNPEAKRISVGIRLLKKHQGSHISSDVLRLIEDYLFLKTDIEALAASTMTTNRAAGKALLKNGFERVAHSEPEDWGFDTPISADKWIFTKEDYLK